MAHAAIICSVSRWSIIHKVHLILFVGQEDLRCKFGEGRVTLCCRLDSGLCDAEKCEQHLHSQQHCLPGCIGNIAFACDSRVVQQYFQDVSTEPNKTTIKEASRYLQIQISNVFFLTGRSAHFH